MNSKPVRQGVPVKQVKEKPVFSTYRQNLLELIEVVPIVIAYSIYEFLRTNVPFYLNAPVLVYTGFLLYLLIYKRRNHKFLAEGGLYFVKRGYAAFVPWEKVKGAEVELPPMGGIWVELAENLTDDQTGTPVVFEDKEELHFPYHRKAEECFLRYVAVTGDKRWEKRRRKRAGRIRS